MSKILVSEGRKETRWAVIITTGKLTQKVTEISPLEETERRGEICIRERGEMKNMREERERKRTEEKQTEDTRVRDDGDNCKPCRRENYERSVANSRQSLLSSA